MKLIKIILKSTFIILLFVSNYAAADILNKIEITGNNRITDETIKLFISVDVKDEIDDVKINNVLKDLYETGYFKNISVNFDKQVLLVNVQENPIIENIFYEGIKSNRVLEIIKQGSLIKQRSSYNENKIKKEKLKIENI